MASERLDIFEKETELCNVIQWVISNKKKNDRGYYYIKEFGIIYPLGRTFFSLKERSKKECPAYDWIKHNVIIVKNEKKWLLTRIKYGA